MHGWPGRGRECLDAWGAHDPGAVRVARLLRAVSGGPGSYFAAVRTWYPNPNPLAAAWSSAPRPAAATPVQTGDNTRGRENTRRPGAGLSVRSVAAQLGRSPSTISREIRRNTSGAGEAGEARSWHSASTPRRRWENSRDNLGWSDVWS